MFDYSYILSISSHNHLWHFVFVDDWPQLNCISQSLKCSSLTYLATNMYQLCGASISS